jgi:hypothetical protein
LYSTSETLDDLCPGSWPSGWLWPLHPAQGRNSIALCAEMDGKQWGWADFFTSRGLSFLELNNCTYLKVNLL